MDKAVDNMTMELLIIIFLLVVGPLALLAGVDSRTTDTRDTRGWFPNHR
jgi:hypothetical protein